MTRIARSGIWSVPHEALVWLPGIPSSSPAAGAGVNDDRHRFRANSQKFFDDPDGDVTVTHRTEARKVDLS